MALFFFFFTFGGGRDDKGMKIHNRDQSWVRMNIQSEFVPLGEGTEIKNTKDKYLQ